MKRQQITAGCPVLLLGLLIWAFSVLAGPRYNYPVLPPEGKQETVKWYRSEDCYTKDSLTFYGKMCFVADRYWDCSLAKVEAINDTERVILGRMVLIKDQLYWMIGEFMDTNECTLYNGKREEFDEVIDIKDSEGNVIKQITEHRDICREPRPISEDPDPNLLGKLDYGVTINKMNERKIRTAWGIYMKRHHSPARAHAICKKVVIND